MNHQDWRNKKIVVVIPTYNEAENLPILIPQLMGIAPVSVLIVDDNSPDGSGEAAERLKEQYAPRVDVIHRIGVPRGLGLAYLDGFQRVLAGGAEIVIGMDADLSHSPQYIPQMLDMMMEGDYDLVIGSRYIPGGGVDDAWAWQRKLLSWGAQRWARLLLGVKTRDVTGAFRCYSRRALQTLDFSRMQLDGFGFLIEIIYQAERKGLKIGQSPIIFHDREHGASKISIRIQVQAMLSVVKNRFTGAR